MMDTSFQHYFEKCRYDIQLDLRNLFFALSNLSFFGYS